MEDPQSTLTAPLSHCAACNTEILTGDAFCTNCGYPVRGTKKEQDYFMLKRDWAEIDIASFNKKLKTAANSLYYLAAAFVIYGIVFYFLKQDDPNAIAMLLTNLILAFVFLALGGYALKKPLACIVSGLCLYVIVIILNAIADPATIARGAIVKILIIGYLVKGIKSAIEIEKIKKEHNIA